MNSFGFRWTTRFNGTHFTGTLSTRTGIVTENLMLRKAGNDQWMRASRVMQGMHLLESTFFRNSSHVSACVKIFP